MISDNLLKGKEFMRSLPYILTVIVAIAILVLSASSFAQEEEEFSQPIRVSILELLTNPGDYELQPVKTTGYVKFNLQESAIYGSEYTAAKGDKEDAIWIRGMRIKDHSKYNNKYCLIEAVFNPYYKGRGNAWAATFQDVTAIEDLSDY
jgi:hypothetical protein